MNLNISGRELAKILWNLYTPAQWTDTNENMCYSWMFENKIKCKELF